MTPRSIILIGMMGSGKSTVSGLLATMLGMERVDLDEVVATWAGAAIPVVFERLGEPVFRAMEAAAVAWVAARPGLVVATGGGAVMRSASARALRRCGMVVYLSASVDALMDRVGAGDGRPMLSGVASSRRRLSELVNARDAGYRAASHCVVATGAGPAHGVAVTIAALYQEWLREQGDDG